MITLVQAEGNKIEQIRKAFGPHVWHAYRNWWVSLLDYYIMLVSDLTWPQKWAITHAIFWWLSSISQGTWYMDPQQTDLSDSSGRLPVTEIIRTLEENLEKLHS